MTTVILTVLSVFLHDDTEISYFPPLSSSVDLEGGRNLVHTAVPSELSCALGSECLGSSSLLFSLHSFFFLTNIYGHVSAGLL